MSGSVPEGGLRGGLGSVWTRLAACLLGFAFVAYGQYHAGGRDAPFEFPFISRLDGPLEQTFAAPNSLAFALPLFVAGGALFAYGVWPLGAPATSAAPAAPSALPIARWLLALLSLGVAAALFLNTALLMEAYEPYFRWVFAVSLLAPLVALAVIDTQRGCLRFDRSRQTVCGVLVVIAVAGTFVGVNIRDLDSWQYSAIGDEGGFYVLATDILDGNQVNWFSQRLGVFYEHPVLDSAVTAFTMRIFGQGLFGWKMSSVLAIVLTLPFFYWAVAQLCGWRAAVFATVFLGASHYLFAYAHTGYNNIHALLPATAAIACVIAGWRRRSWALLFASGAIAGLGFYTFWSARATIGIVVLAPFVLDVRRPRRDDIGSYAALLGGFLLAVAPIFATDGWYVISAMKDQSAANQDTGLFEQLLENTPRAFLGFNFSGQALHYVAGALADGITAALAIAGFAVTLSRPRHGGYRLLLLWFFVAVAVAGVFFRYPYVAVSRLHFALPPVAAFSGIAVDRALAWAERIERPGWSAGLAAVITLVVLAPALFVINGDHFFHDSAGRHRTTPETVVARELSAAQCRDGALRSTVIMNGPNVVLDYNWHFFGMEDRKPIQLAIRDVDRTYFPHPGAGGGTGCTALAEPELPDVARHAAALYQGGNDAGDPAIVHDRSKQVPVLLATGEDRGPITAGDLDAAWATELRDVDLSTVVKGQERGFVDSLDGPEFLEPSATRTHPYEQVIVISDGEQSRAYPIRVLLWHGVINDTFAGHPIAVTYDVIAGAPRVFVREVDGQPITLALTGLLKDGNALLYDREGESWWRQLTGEAVAGSHAGKRLDLFPSFIASWESYAFSERERSRLLRTGAQAEEPYWRNPYLGYDAPDGQPVFTRTGYPRGLAAMRRVAVVDVGDREIAIAFPENPEQRNLVAPITVEGRDYDVLYDWKLVSGLDSWEPTVLTSRYVGTVSVFEAVDGELRPENGGTRGFVDQAGNTYNSYGLAVFGPNDGSRLPAPAQTTAFWFAASAAYPGIQVIDPW